MGDCYKCGEKADYMTAEESKAYECEANGINEVYIGESVPVCNKCFWDQRKE